MFKFNLIKQLFGGRARVTIDVPVLLNRGVAVAAVLSTGGTVAGLIPGHLGVALTGALGLIASAGPGVLQAAGLRRAVSPEATSVKQAIGDALAAPEAARKQAERDAQTAFVESVAQQAVQDYLNKSGRFTAASEFGKLDFGAALGSAAQAAEGDLKPETPATGAATVIVTGPAVADSAVAGPVAA